MSQYDFGTIDPGEKDGTELAADLNGWRDALNSMHRGNTRPTYAVQGMMWIDDTSSPWLIKTYNGAVSGTDTTVGSYVPTTGVYTPYLASNQVTLDKMSRTGTAGQVLTSGGAGADPSYINQSAVTSGAVSVIDSAKTIGYGSGSGGTVTQATSKSTAVTLNKPTGQIATHNAALAAGSQVTFQLNNSIVVESDICVVSKNASTANQSVYKLDASCASGSVIITITNTHTASLSDPIYINFAIIKGSYA